MGSVTNLNNMEKKKLVICASASFEKEVIYWKNKLEQQGFKVIKYPQAIEGNLLEEYQKEFSEHYSAMAQADVLFILNLEKKGISGYLGPGVYAEIAFVLGMNQALHKQIEVYYLNPISKNVLPYSDELELWRKLGWIQIFNKEAVLK